MQKHKTVCKYNPKPPILHCRSKSINRKAMHYITSSCTHGYVYTHTYANHMSVHGHYGLCWGAEYSTAYFWAATQDSFTTTRIQTRQHADVNEPACHSDSPSHVKKGSDRDDDRWVRLGPGTGITWHHRCLGDSCSQGGLMCTRSPHWHTQSCGAHGPTTNTEWANGPLNFFSRWYGLVQIQLERFRGAPPCKDAGDSVYITTSLSHERVTPR